MRYVTDHRFITQSELKDYRRCKRAWHLKWNRRLRKKEFRPSALSQGTYFHLGMENRHDSDPEAWRHAIDAAVEADRERCDELFHKDMDKQHKLAMVMVEGMIEWAEAEGLDVGITVLESEREVCVDLGDYSLMGKWDEYVLNEETGETGYRDYKTAPNFSLFKLASQDEQFLVYEVLRRANGESASGWGQWVVARKVLRTAAAKPPFYDKHTRRFNDHQVDGMRNRIHGLWQEMERDRRNIADGHDPLVVVPPTPTWECPRCPYFTVCSMHDDGSRVEEAIEATYDVKDPNERYKQRAAAQGENE